VVHVSPSYVHVSNYSLLLWRLDSVPLPIVIKPKVVKLCNGDPSGDCKCKVTPIKTK